MYFYCKFWVFNKVLMGSCQSCVYVKSLELLLRIETNNMNLGNYCYFQIETERSTIFLKLKLKRKKEIIIMFNSSSSKEKFNKRHWDLFYKKIIVHQFFPLHIACILKNSAIFTFGFIVFQANLKSFRLFH